MSPQPSRRLAEAAPTPPAPGCTCRQVSGAALRKGRSRDSRPCVRVGARGCAWVPCAPSPSRCFPAAPCPYPRFPEAVSVPDKASFIPAAALPRPSLPPPRIPDTRTERGVPLDGKTPSAHTHTRVHARTHAHAHTHTRTVLPAQPVESWPSRLSARVRVGPPGTPVGRPSPRQRAGPAHAHLRPAASAPSRLLLAPSAHLKFPREPASPTSARSSTPSPGDMGLRGVTPRGERGVRALRTHFAAWLEPRGRSFPSAACGRHPRPEAPERTV